LQLSFQSSLRKVKASDYAQSCPIFAIIASLTVFTTLVSIVSIPASQHLAVGFVHFKTSLQATLLT
jgi:hypothetical protein